MSKAQSSKLAQAYGKGIAQGRDMLRQDACGHDQVHLEREQLRLLAGEIGWGEQETLDHIIAFHKERIDAVPDLNVYPELRGARDELLQRYRGMADAGVPEDVIALAETQRFWRDTRLLQDAEKSFYLGLNREKCRVVYVPESDVGALHSKNVDDPLANWKPIPPYGGDPRWDPPHPLWFDGVGSGLHIDEIPPEIFPVDPHTLCQEHCRTVPEATEFMVRYNYFWSGQNLLVHDHHGNSVAFAREA